MLLRLWPLLRLLVLLRLLPLLVVLRVLSVTRGHRQGQHPGARGGGEGFDGRGAADRAAGRGGAAAGARCPDRLFVHGQLSIATCRAHSAPQTDLRVRALQIRVPGKVSTVQQFAEHYRHPDVAQWIGAVLKPVEKKAERLCEHCWRGGSEAVYALSSAAAGSDEGEPGEAEARKQHAQVKGRSFNCRCHASRRQRDLSTD